MMLRALYPMALAAQVCCGQEDPTTNDMVATPQFSTNVIVDGTPMTIQPSNTASVNMDGWVGYTTPAGQTNPVIVARDSVMSQVAPNLTIETTPDGSQKILGRWQGYSFTNSPDLINWSVTTVWWQPVYCVPAGTPQQFFAP